MLPTAPLILQGIKKANQVVVRMAPAIPRHASLCSLLSLSFARLLMDLWHHCMEAYVAMGITTLCKPSKLF